MRDGIGIGYLLEPDGAPIRSSGEACKVNFGALKSDDRTTAQRLGDVLLESHREDTSHKFRLGLLQGALAIALPELVQATARVSQTVRIELKRDELIHAAEEVAASMKEHTAVAGATSTTSPRAKAKSHRPSQPKAKGSPRHA